jgi:hypothetical protein
VEWTVGVKIVALSSMAFDLQPQIQKTYKHFNRTPHQQQNILNLNLLNIITVAMTCKFTLQASTPILPNLCPSSVEDSSAVVVR